ncbi:hypothetical protein ACFE04_005533 [Oxalis oulophora]
MSILIRLKQRLPINPTKVYSVMLMPPRNYAQAATKQVEYDQRRLPADYDPKTFDPTEHRSPPTERVWRLVDEISNLTLSEIAELGTIIMKKRGMTQPPTVGVMKPGMAMQDTSRLCFFVEQLVVMLAHCQSMNGYNKECIYLFKRETVEVARASFAEMDVARDMYFINRLIARIRFQY